MANPAQPLEARLTQLDRLKQGKVARAEIVKDEAAGRSAFGGLWRGERSDAGQLAAVVEWQAGLGEAGKSVRRVVTREPEREEASRLLDSLAGLAAVQEATDQVMRFLGRPPHISPGMQSEIHVRGRASG